MSNSDWYCFYGCRYVVMGRALCFYSCDLFTYLFFALLSLRQKNATPLDLCQDVGMWCNVIMQIRGSPVCIPCILRVKNLQILHHSWTMVRPWTVVIWKRLCLCLFLTVTARLCIRQLYSCRYWEWCAVFSTPILGRAAIMWYFHATSSSFHVTFKMLSLFCFISNSCCLSWINLKQLLTFYGRPIIGQAIIFLPCEFFFCRLLSFFPCIISAVADWMSTILAHIVWP